MIHRLLAIVFSGDFMLTELQVLVTKIIFGIAILMSTPTATKSTFYKNVNELIDPRIIGALFIAFGTFHFISLMRGGRVGRIIAALMGTVIWATMFAISMKTAGLIWPFFLMWTIFQTIIFVRLWKERFREFE